VFNNLQSSDDRNATTLYLDAEEQQMLAGQTYTATFKPETMDALQFTLQLTGLEIIGTDLDATMFALHKTAMTVAIDKPKPFTVTFRATRNGTLSKMLTVTSNITRASAFRGDARSEVALRFANATAAQVGFALYQNEPNPFSERTVIRFDLPKATKATLRVYDELGRTLYTTTSDYAAGDHTIALTKEHVTAKGVLFYTLTTPDASATMQMVRMD
jgi:hypothetical protein